MMLKHETLRLMTAFIISNVPVTRIYLLLRSGAIKTEVQPNAESVTLSAFHVYCTPPCCQAGGDVVILFTWSTVESSAEHESGEFGGRAERGVSRD